MTNKKQEEKVSKKEKEKKIEKAEKKKVEGKKEQAKQEKEEKEIKEVKEIKEKEEPSKELIPVSKAISEAPEENLERIVRVSPTVMAPSTAVARTRAGVAEPEEKKYVEEKKEYEEFKPEFEIKKETRETREREYETPLIAGMAREEVKRKYEPTAPVEREERKLPFEAFRRREEEKRYEVSPVREPSLLEREKEKRKYRPVR